ncbi:MAG: PQQ-binding-like beta-propeller repeat protein [Planctomycetia bacterium]|nr:PQQ-binding-like beta-propeller repeat protein [Planctomycetia bacterium]
MPFRSALLVLLTCAATARGGDDWPQFRGPDGQGHSDSTGVPLAWSETEHVRWKTEIPGEGWSSPVVQRNQVWMTTATKNGCSLRAICANRATGRIVHDVEVFKRNNPIEKHATNSYASPTPIIDGDRLYVSFGTMGTACLDAHTGAIVWQTQVLELDHEVGPGSSPAIFGNLLLFNCDGTDVQYGAALDKSSGALVWKTPRSGVITKPKDRKKAFSTPLVIQSTGRDLVIMTAAEWVYAYDPRSGDEIWNVKHPGFSIAPRPVFGHGLVFVSSGYILPEFLAIRPDGAGDITATNVVWRTDKGVPAKPSPLLVGDELYLLSDGGVISCLDAKTGKQHWRQRLGGGNFSASPIEVEGRIYCCGEDGRTIVFAAGQKFKELARNQLTGRFMASPAVAGRALYLRTDTHLYRIEE